MDLGLIGLGVMGKSLVLNFEDKGYSVCVYNRTKQRTRDFLAGISSSKIKPAYEMEEFASSLKSPRKIFVVVEAGKAVDAVLEGLAPLLSEEDVVIDFGNSHYKDTKERCQKFHGKFLYMGCGVSGGERGARYGPSLMLGGSEVAWLRVREALMDISARYTLGGESYPCCSWVGEDGSGHFVKTIHNGIEYGDMAIISEVYLILKSLGYNNEEMSKLFSKWNENKELEGYLMGMTSTVVGKMEGDCYIIDDIEDLAEQKGTGAICVVSSIEASSPAVLMAESVFSRMVSFRKEKRVKFSKYKRVGESSVLITEEDLEKCLVLSKAVSYVQGLNLMKCVSDLEKWGLNLMVICRVWRNGCIIRCGFLETVEKIIEEVEDDYELSETFIKFYQENINHLRRVVLYSIEVGVPIPTISSCLAYLDGIGTKRGGGNLIQGLRDLFGAHGFRRVGKTENTHLQWMRRSL
jgi:6-phosphogluconate dehydrogenase